jgi:hypothetical protein
VSNIIELPKKKSPKQLARAYMMGELSPNEYPPRGGLLNAMLLADGAESEIARMQALTFIEKLADLGRDVDTQSTMQIKLIGIKNDGEGNAVRIESA